MMSDKFLFERSNRVDRSAEISECGRYRWWLRRSWPIWENGQHVVGKGVCCFLMLNPSTADAMQDDPTIRRCIGFCRSWGYDTLSVRNLFALRATDPAQLLLADTPTGGARGDMELLTAPTADMLVIAWGAKVPFHRDYQAMSMFRKHFPCKPLFCLGLTKGGHPRHPLYVKADQQPVRFCVEQVKESA